MHSRPRHLLAILGVLALAASLQSATIASFTNTTGASPSEGSYFFGQSVTTLAGPSWNSLTFNVFGVGAAVPHAGGTLYLLSQAYTGTPAALDNTVPGWIASTSNIVADKWVFDPAVIIQAGTQYFFFAGSPVTLSGNTNLYPGGTFYSTLSAGSPFSPIPGDVYFSLNGLAVPEANSALPIAAALLALVAIRPRK